MSVVLNLYELDKDIKFHPSPYQLASPTEREKCIEMSDEECEKFLSCSFTKNGEKTEDWCMMNITYLKDLGKCFSRCKLFTRYYNKLMALGVQKVEAKDEIFYVLPVKSILYMQGWFLNKRFFHKQCTLYYATTKEELIRFFDLYLDFKHNKRCREIKESFLANWRDGLLFEATF